MSSDARQSRLPLLWGIFLARLESDSDATHHLESLRNAFSFGET